MAGYAGGPELPALLHYLNVRTRHGCQDVVIHLLDQRLPKALSHRLRQRILQHLVDHGVASPSELAEALGEQLGDLSYHVRILHDLGYVELVRTEPRRGALKHFYRAASGPWLDDEQWAQLPASIRRTTLARTLVKIVQDATAASQEDGFDGPWAYASRAELVLDDEGRRQVNALLATTLDTALRIHAASATRAAEAGPGASPTTPTEIAIVHLGHSDAK